MKKILLSLVAPFIAFALSAEGIGTTSHEEADAIVLERLSQETRPYTLHVTKELQKDMLITSSAGELLELNYWCWVYYVSYTDTNQGCYLIVKEANGNLLEVDAKSGAEPEDLAEWSEVNYNTELCHCIMDTLKGDWIWFETSLEGRGGEGSIIPFKSIIKILSQNEDKSVNYQVFVADTLFYAGSFKIQELLPGYFHLDYRRSNIKLPHIDAPIDGYWLFLFLGKEEIYFYNGYIGFVPQNFYHYKKIGEE